MQHIAYLVTQLCRLRFQYSAVSRTYIPFVDTTPYATDGRYPTDGARTEIAHEADDQYGKRLQ